MNFFTNLEPDPVLSTTLISENITVFDFFIDVFSFFFRVLLSPYSFTVPVICFLEVTGFDFIKSLFYYIITQYWIPILFTGTQVWR